MFPKVDQPIFEVTLPSSGKKIKCRPYLVKEEEILLQAVESKNAKDIGIATLQIVNNCIVDPGVEAAGLPIFDFDFVYMNLRAKSVGDKITQEYTCRNKTKEDGKECGNKFNVDFNLKDVEIVRKGELPDKIMLGPDMGVKMHYPSFSTTQDIDVNQNALTNTLWTLYGSIEYTYDKEQTYSMRDAPFQEFKDWVETLTKEQFSKMTDYIENMPTFLIEVKHKCEKCGFDHVMRYDEPVNFF